MPGETEFSQESNTETESTEGQTPEPQALETAPEKTQEEQLQDLLDLDKIEKFKWKGKTWSLKDLEKTSMLQSDYTRKMQALADQRKSVEQLEKNKDFYENLDADLLTVKKNPALAAEFKKIYPAQFHRYLDIVGADGTMKEEQPTSQKTQAVNDPELLEMKQFFKEQRALADEQRQQAASDFVNATFDRMNQKYPDALEETVLAKVIRLNELHRENPGEYKKPDEKVIEELFKASSEAQLGFAKSYMERTLKEQKAVNEKAKGPASGGGIPGGAPKTPRNIKEATEMALSDPSWA